MLDDGAELGDVVARATAVDLVEGDEQPGAVALELVGQGVQLRAQAPGRVGGRQLELHSPEVRRQVDPGDPSVLARPLAQQVGQLGQRLAR